MNARPSRWQQRRQRRWLRDCTFVGSDPQLYGKPTITTEGQISIGNHFRLASSPIRSHFAVGPGAMLSIGNDVAIGHGAAISAFQQVTIGAGTLIGPFAIIMDTNFHGSSGEQALHHDCRPILIGENCRIGSRVTIARGATIGDGAEVLAGSVVSSSVPAGACVAGARARIIGRANEAASRWHGTGVALGEILAEILDLATVPDLDQQQIPHALTEAHTAASFAREVENRLGFKIDELNFAHIACLGDLAALIDQRALQHRIP